MAASESSPPDARVPVAPVAGGMGVQGTRCVECGYRTAGAPPCCPECAGSVEPAVFGPGGTIWASTTVWIDVQDRDAPYSIAYVDVDDGPRILAHVAGGDPASPPSVGRRVSIVGLTERGDPAVALVSRAGATAAAQADGCDR